MDSSHPRLSRRVYVRAERFLDWNVRNSVFNVSVEPNWLADGGFWYRRQSRKGTSFVRVDATGRSRPAFDHEGLARCLVALGHPCTAATLPFEQIAPEGEDGAVVFEIAGQRWRFAGSDGCVAFGKTEVVPDDALRSPNGRWEVIRIGDDLGVRHVASGRVCRITDDGAPDNAYASLPDTQLNAVTRQVQRLPDRPVALWSSDSRYFVSYRLDQRSVGMLPLVQSRPSDGSTRPYLHRLRMPLPGDTEIARATLFIFDTEREAVIPVLTDPLSVPFFSPIDLGWIWWSGDSARVYFLRESSGAKRLELCTVDAGTGVGRTIFDESSATYVEPSPLLPWRSHVRTLFERREIIWPSERDGWRHLYLVDEATGRVKRQLTTGRWVVRDVIDIDPRHHFLYFTASGREPECDPYLRQFYRVSLDGSEPELLTAADADHTVHLSPDRSYFVDNHSRVDCAPASELRSTEGRRLATLEAADLDILFEHGFHFPERFTAKAADGTTDLYGVLYKPGDFDPAHRYPVIDDIYPGPQLIRSPTSFCVSPAAVFETWPGAWISQSVAELGFIVVNIDGRGTPLRSQAFHLASYGRLQDAGCLEDHIAVLGQLARDRPYLDLDRLGAVGHSGGGYAVTRALLAHPKHYKVGVASSGDQDLMCYLGYWAEKYQGLPIDERYADQANEALAEALQGRLLLIHGELDDNVNPYATMRFVDALIRANKDFDLLIVPGANHNLLDHPYVIRRKWDYLVEHLMGVMPPTEYRIAPEGGA